MQRSRPNVLLCHNDHLTWSSLSRHPFAVAMTARAPIRAPSQLLLLPLLFSLLLYYSLLSRLFSSYLSLFSLLCCSVISPLLSSYLSLFPFPFPTFSCILYFLSHLSLFPSP